MADFTENRTDIFLDTLAATCHVGKACKAAGVSPSNAYHRRKEDPDFAARWEEAKTIGITVLEDEATRRAFHGIDKPIVHKGQFSYVYRDVYDELLDEWRPQLVRDEDGQPVIATIKEYSDSLAMFLLKAHDPERFRESQRIDLGNADGKPFETSDGAVAAKLAAIIEAARARRDNGGDLV